MNSVKTSVAVLLLLAATGSLPGQAVADRLKSVLVRTDRECWQDIRKHALPDSGVTAVLGSGEHLAVRSWAFDGQRRVIRLWLPPAPGDSMVTRPAADVLSFEFQKRVKTGATARVLGVMAGVVVGGWVAADRTRIRTRAAGSPYPLLDVLGTGFAETGRVFAVAAGALLGGTAGYVIGNAVTPRVPRVVACECAEAAPAAAAAAVGE
jgi:hypothetical protein